MGEQANKRWLRIRKRLAKATTDADALEAFSTPGAGTGRLKDVYRDSSDAVWDNILRLSLKDIAVAVMLSEGVHFERERGTWKRRRSPRMTPAEMEISLEQIQAVVTKAPGLRCSEIAEKVDLDRQRCGKLLVKLRQAGKLRSEGERAATVYFPV